MTQEDKKLLAKDIFSRVLTGLKVDYNGVTFTLGYNLYLEDGDMAFESYPMKYFWRGIETIKPYLRPMSSMTEEESLEYEQLCKNLFTVKNLTYCWEIVDWLNARHFDHRFLIEKGLALEAPEGMYKTE